MRARGFTLLEVVIAMAIMTIAFVSILLMQSSGLRATGRARDLSTISMLAKSILTDTELKMQEGDFTALKEEDNGEFPTPFEGYAWTRIVREVNFPALGAGKEKESTPEQAEQVTKLVTNFLSKSLREVTVTIVDKTGVVPRNYPVSMYWVDLNHEFSLTP